MDTNSMTTIIGVMLGSGAFKQPGKPDVETVRGNRKQLS